MPPQFSLNASPSSGSADLVRQLLARNLLANQNNPIETPTELVGNVAQNAALAFKESMRRRREQEAEANLAKRLSSVLGGGQLAGPGVARPSKGMQLARALLSDPSTRGQGVQLAMGLLTKERPETSSVLTAEQEIGLFGEDKPGSFQQSSRGGVTQIGGTSPVLPEAPKAVAGIPLRRNPQTNEFETDEALLEQARRLRRAGATTVTVGGKPLTPLAEMAADEEAGRVPKGSTAAKARKLGEFTSAQTKVAGFARGMEQANLEMEALIAQGFDPTGIFDEILRGLPGGNIVRSEDAQLFFGAAEDFANSTIREESGAAIGKDEVKKAIIRYIPIPGDGPRTIAVKKRRREARANVFKKESQGAYEELFPDLLGPAFPENSPTSGPPQQDTIPVLPSGTPVDKASEGEIDAYLRSRGLQ